MDRFNQLSEEYRLLMHTFSKRTIDLLKRQPFFKLLFPAVSKFLDENVEKEIRKDILTMRLVFNAYELEKKVSEKELEEIFEKTKEIDEEFIKKTRGLPLSLDLSYEEIGAIRRRRIQFLAKLVCDILSHWEDDGDLHETFRLLYKKEELRKVLLQLLHLYNLETRHITGSIKLPLLFQGAKEAISKNLYHAMETVAKEIAEEWSNKVFNPQTL